MNCSEFQKVLPFIMESGGSLEEQEHLKECPVCSDLVADLEYIAQQAKLLLPMRDPSPKVWDKIHNSLEREGLVASGKSGMSSVAKLNGVPAAKKVTGDR